MHVTGKADVTCMQALIGYIYGGDIEGQSDNEKCDRFVL